MTFLERLHSNIGMANGHVTISIHLVGSCLAITHNRNEVLKAHVAKGEDFNMKMCGSWPRSDRPMSINLVVCSNGVAKRKFRKNLRLAEDGHEQTDIDCNSGFEFTTGRLSFEHLPFSATIQRCHRVEVSLYRVPISASHDNH